ncbi:hypothetical protein JCM33374_g4175 [Metschnikowia sp. JCM 33374]|nr:hypothetical protein JCM33374_g4175 [Metschnikowia sp. JCM 33374]
MRAVVLLSLGLVAHSVACGIEPSSPFNLELYDSHIPSSLSENLMAMQNHKNASEPWYERLFVDSTPGHADSDSGDQYLCKMLSKSAIEKRKTPQPLIEPEKESQAAILHNAMKIVHETFPPNACLWAYELRGKYWSYALCSADKIIQYHEGAIPEERNTNHVAESPSTVFVLGRFSPASTKEVLFENQASIKHYNTYVRDAERSARLLDEKSAPFSHHAAQKVVSQIVTDGSVCDMTYQPRTIEVVYKCDANGGPNPSIVDVAETKTCHYKMSVHVPSLCGYEPFSPHRHSQVSAVDIPCQRIRKSKASGKQSPKKQSQENFEAHASLHEHYDEYTTNTVLRDHMEFPVRADNRIDIADHYIVALGQGFYVARSKKEFQTPSSYFNMRNVVIYNGFYSSLTDLNTQFAKMIFKGIGTTLLAPTAPEEGPKIIDWSHSFIMWFEIYDYKGDFVALSRLEHDATEDPNSLKSQFLDPVSLLDVEGEPPKMVRFDRPEFQAPHGMWNFEAFSEDGGPLPKRGSHVTEDQSVELLDDDSFRTIIMYNRGLTENSQVNMELVDQKTGKVLEGHYGDYGQYIFALEIKEGLKQEFAISPMNQDQDVSAFILKLSAHQSPESIEKSAIEEDTPEKEDEETQVLAEKGHHEFELKEEGKNSEGEEFKSHELQEKQPKVQEQHIQEPGVHQAEVHQAEVHQAEVHQAEVHQAEIHQPEVQQQQLQVQEERQEYEIQEDSNNPQLRESNIPERQEPLFQQNGEINHSANEVHLEHHQNFDDEKLPRERDETTDFEHHHQSVETQHFEETKMQGSEQPVDRLIDEL